MTRMIILKQRVDYNVLLLYSMRFPDQTNKTHKRRTKPHMKVKVALQDDFITHIEESLKMLTVTSAEQFAICIIPITTVVDIYKI